MVVYKEEFLYTSAYFFPYEEEEIPVGGDPKDEDANRIDNFLKIMLNKDALGMNAAVVFIFRRYLLVKSFGYRLLTVVSLIVLCDLKV